MAYRRIGSRRAPFIAEVVEMKIPLLLFIPLALALAQSPAPSNQGLYREVAHQLVKLPYLTIFDSVSLRVDGNTVTLMGEVTNPILKRDAEKLVRRVEGVEQVINRIEVLPLSPYDEEIRRATYEALVRQPQLRDYFLQVLCPIRIIVKNGNVTLEGVVSNRADSDLARLTANNVPGVFSFTSNLQVAK
jgi:hyperosmotically inducible periplasmic protein